MSNCQHKVNISHYSSMIYKSIDNIDKEYKRLNILRQRATDPSPVEASISRIINEIRVVVLPTFVLLEQVHEDNIQLKKSLRDVEDTLKKIIDEKSELNR